MEPSGEITAAAPAQQFEESWCDAGGSACRRTGGAESTDEDLGAAGKLDRPTVVAGSTASADDAVVLVGAGVSFGAGRVAEQSEALVGKVANLESFATVMAKCVVGISVESRRCLVERTISTAIGRRLGFAQTVIDHVGRVSAEASAILIAAAVVGSPFGLGDLLPFLEASHDRDGLQTAMSELESRGIVHKIDEGYYALKFFARAARQDLESAVHCDESIPSRREFEVAGLIADGLTNYQIGRRLGLSERTIETYVRRLFVKLQVFSRSEVAVWFMRRQCC